MTRKNIITIILVLLLMAVTIVGATYAYYAMVVAGSQNVQANSKKYAILFQGGEHITGEMPISDSKAGGKNTTVQIGLAPDSASANATLYIQIVSITNNLAIAGFNWEVYRMNGTSEIYVNSGNFLNKANGDQIPIVTNYQLSETATRFKIYLWIDGENTDSNIKGGSFDGYVGAYADITTGIVKN